MKNRSRKLLDEVESSAGFDRLTARSKMKTLTVLGLYCRDRVWRGLRLAALESGLYISHRYSSHRVLDTLASFGAFWHYSIQLQPN